jgi:hypothetical protein
MKTCHCICMLHHHLSTVRCEAAEPSDPWVALHMVRVTVPPRDVPMCKECAEWWRESESVTPPAPTAYFDSRLLYEAIQAAKQLRGIRSDREVCEQLGMDSGGSGFMTRLGNGGSPDATNLVRVLTWLGITDIARFISYRG